MRPLLRPVRPESPAPRPASRTSLQRRRLSSFASGRQGGLSAAANAVGNFAIGRLALPRNFRATGLLHAQMSFRRPLIVWPRQSRPLVRFCNVKINSCSQFEAIVFVGARGNGHAKRPGDWRPTTCRRRRDRLDQALSLTTQQRRTPIPGRRLRRRERRHVPVWRISQPRTKRCTCRQRATNP